MSKSEFEMQVLNSIGEETLRDFGESISVRTCRQGYFQWVRITPSHRKGMTVDLLLEEPGVVRVIGRGGLDQEFTGKNEQELRATVIEFVGRIGKFGASVRRIGPWTIGQAEVPQVAEMGHPSPKNILLYRTWSPWR
ncbi:MAG: hypothetical protein H7288_25540 [Kineosporiaceae bacterium]|nr:hypothetical protein [Aeromicrobium sp.]